MFPGMNMNANFQGNNDPNKAQMNVNMGMPGMGMPGMQMNINAQGPNPGGFQQYPGYQPQPQPQPQYSQQYPPQYGGPQNVQANIGMPGMPGMGINMQVSGQPQNYGQPQNNFGQPQNNFGQPQNNFGQFPQQPQYPNQYPQQYPGNPQNVQANIGFPGMGMGINMEVKGQGFGQPGFNQPMQPMQPMQPGFNQPMPQNVNIQVGFGGLPSLQTGGPAMPTMLVGVNNPQGTTFNDYLVLVKGVLEEGNKLHIDDVKFKVDGHKITGIETRYNCPKYNGGMFENWEKKHAAKDNKGKEEHLHVFDDEEIIMITGRYDHEGITRLCLHKSNGNKLEFGKD